jgi:hypothetical protein
MGAGAIVPPLIPAGGVVMQLLLIASGVVAILFGLFFLLGAERAVRSFDLGASNLAIRLFVRSEGAALVSVGIINLLANIDDGSPALKAIVIGNIAIHALSVAVDFSERYQRKAGVWFGLLVHVVFLVWFGYWLINFPAATPG